MAHAVKQIDDMAEWRFLLTEAISASANLSQLERDGELVISPLYSFLIAFVVGLYRNSIRWRKPFDDILRIWVSELKHAGVDLEAYGADEQALFKVGHAFVYLPVQTDLGPRRNDEILWGKALGLEYGPEPEDWHIFVTNPVDEYVGEFWESLQRGLEAMPGTWVD